MEHGTAYALAAPFGEHEPIVQVQARAVRLGFPGDAVIGHHFAANLRDEHILARIVVSGVAVDAGDDVERHHVVAQVVGQLAASVHFKDAGVILIAPEVSKP